VLQCAAARRATYPGLLQELGKLLRAEGQPEEAAKVFQKAATPDPGWDGLVARPRPPGPSLPGPGVDPRLIAALDGLATALLDQGRFAEARAASERLVDL